MPEITNEKKEPKKTNATAKKATASKKTTTAKKTTASASSKKATSTAKKAPAKTSSKAPEAKKTTKKSTAKKPTEKKVAAKTTTKAASKSTTAKTSTAKKTTTRKTTTKKATTKKETVASKAVKEAKEKVANEVKETLKQEVSKVEVKKPEEKKVDNKVNNKKEETIIQKIKNFIAKIVAMQEEARKESENKKALQESIKEDKEKEEVTFEQKSKYMLEYYDLPYRYNETVVKILAQTPKRLFVYWDISDSDRTKYQTAFGERFFEDTYPVLLVHNEEKNYTFEVPINDFANSWYLDINDPKSKYVIQLGRKFKTKPEFVNIATTAEGTAVELHNDYVPITTSNVLEVPNDHILFENMSDKALYRNVKTNEESYVDISNSDFMKKMGKIYSIYDLYKEIYKNELGDGSLTDLLNPSSMSSSGTSSSMFR